MLRIGFEERFDGRRDIDESRRVSRHDSFFDPWSADDQRNVLGAPRGAAVVSFAIRFHEPGRHGNSVFVVHQHDVGTLGHIQRRQQSDLTVRDRWICQATGRRSKDIVSLWTPCIDGGNVRDVSTDQSRLDFLD